MEGQKIQWPQDTKGVINGKTDNTMATRYQRGNKKSSMEGQIIQWPQDTKGVIRSHQWKDR
jgi:hypothetical protein